MSRQRRGDIRWRGPRDRIQSPKSGSWHFDGWVAGKRHRFSLKTRDARAASLKAAKFREQKELEAAGVVTHTDTNETPPKELVKRYGNELERRGRELRHRKLVERRLAEVFGYHDDCTLGEIGRLTELTPEFLAERLTDIADARASLPGVNVAERTLDWEPGLHSLAVSEWRAFSGHDRPILGLGSFRPRDDKDAWRVVARR